MIYHNYSVLTAILFIEVALAKKSKSKRKQEPIFSDEVWHYIFIALGVTILLGILIFLIKKRQQLLRAAKLKSIKKALQVKQLSRKDKSCTMTQMQKDQAVDWFSKQNWILQQKSSKQKITEFNIKIKNIKRKTQDVDGQKLLKDYYDAFHVEMQGSGAGGSCDLFGVIMFEKFYMTILFEKSFSNSKNSDGYYDYKFFDAGLKKGTFEGKWYTSNDLKIDAELQAYRQRQRNKQQGSSQRSFTKDAQEIFSPALRRKQQRGNFRLYHK